MALIGGSSSSTQQDILNQSITQQLDNIDGAVVTDITGDVTILDGGAIAAANNLSQAAVQSNAAVVTNVTGGAFDVLGDAISALGNALGNTSDLVAETIQSTGAQVATITREVANSTRSDASQNVNNIARLAAVTVGVLGVAWMIKQRGK